MRHKTSFIPGEIYHIFNRGNNKQNIFLDERDYARFLFLILFFQSPEQFFNIGKNVSAYLKYTDFNITRSKMAKVLGARTVQLIAFCLMPNHFHLLLQELTEGGLSNYLMRIQNSYTKYFNEKYQNVGHHLLQGPFGAAHIKNNEQFLYVSTYIHRNPHELARWRNKENLYPWSSYSDFIGENRWGELLQLNIILSQFSSPGEYYFFTKKSLAKAKRLDEIILQPTPYRG